MVQQCPHLAVIRLPPCHIAFRQRRLVDDAGRRPGQLDNLLRQLHDSGVNHRDYYAGHVLVDRLDRLHLVDLGRAEIRRRVPRRRVIKDLAAFLFSVPERVVDVELREHFVRSYLGENPETRVTDLVATVTRKSRWMRRHAERKLARGETNIHVNT